MLMISWTFVITFASVVYPSVYSIRTLQKKNKSEIQKCLTYWMLIGIYTLFNTFFGFILEKIPFWNIIRFVLVLWLCMRELKGAEWVYINIVKNL